MEIVVDRLLYEEKKSKDRLGEIETNQDGALVAKQKSVKWKYGIRCHYCGKIGHMQRDCCERKKEKFRNHQYRKWKRVVNPVILLVC